MNNAVNYVLLLSFTLLLSQNLLIRNLLGTDCHFIYFRCSNLILIIITKNHHCWSTDEI